MPMRVAPPTDAAGLLPVVCLAVLQGSNETSGQYNMKRLPKVKSSGSKRCHHLS